MKKIFLVLFSQFALFSPLAFGFIEPATEGLKETFLSRKPKPAILVKWRHDVQAREGETIALEESVLRVGSQLFFRWSSPNGGAVTAVLNGSKYSMTPPDSKMGGDVAAPNQAFVRYLTGGTMQEFLDNVIREGFIRREQLLQFTPSFNPEGDPKTWDSNANYLRHPDISLRNVEGQPWVIIQGSRQGDKAKNIYFDRNQGNPNKTEWALRKLEWRSGQDTAGWTTYRNTSLELGRYPREMALSLNGVIRIQTRLVSMQGIGAAEIARVRKEFQSGLSSSQAVDFAVRNLLKYR